MVLLFCNPLFNLQKQFDLSFYRGPGPAKVTSGGGPPHPGPQHCSDHLDLVSSSNNNNSNNNNNSSSRVVAVSRGWGRLATILQVSARDQLLCPRSCGGGEGGGRLEDSGLNVTENVMYIRKIKFKYSPFMVKFIYFYFYLFDNKYLSKKAFDSIYVLAARSCVKSMCPSEVSLMFKQQFSVIPGYYSNEF